MDRDKMSEYHRTIMQGDCLDKLKEIQDNSIDEIVTDPPYGYSFMNKDWDKAVVKKEVWIECLRVLKPGSFAFVMSAPRQDVLSHMIVNLTDAGFETGFTSMYWAYASGFPKAMNISKAVDKKLGVEREIIGKSGDGANRKNSPYSTESGWNENDLSPPGNLPLTKPSSPQAKRLDGSYAGFQPKPAVEVILVCMKPLSEKNYVEQALSNGKGVTWFDDCRIPYKNDESREVNKNGYNTGIYEGGFKPEDRTSNPQGRFPANLIVSDNVLDVGKITNRARPNIQGKIYKSGFTGKIYGKYPNENFVYNTPQDKGDFSRYFSLDSWEAQFIITPKPTKSEKNKGLGDLNNKFLATMGDGMVGREHNPENKSAWVKNNHPTVKPIKLFKYLITLGSRENNIVLDPFMGSGTTAIACEQINRKWIGIEINKEYCEIIEARVNNYKKQTRLIV